MTIMSKVGPHWMLNGYDVDKWLRDTPPAIALFCLPKDGGFNGGVREQAPNYCQPETIAVGHILLHDGPIILGYGLGEEYRAGYTPGQVAQAYWDKYLGPLSAAYPRIDVWSFYNEFEHDDNSPAPEQYIWYSWVCYETTKLLWEQRGKKSAVGACATHRPDKSQYPNWDIWFTPCLEACLQFGAYWTRHGYDAFGPTEDGSLRYRDDLRRFAARGYYPNVILSEVGQDWPPFKDRYGPRDYATQYVAILEQELRKDKQLVGAALFTYGNGG